MGGSKKKNLLADTVIREINEEDSLHKPWAPVFQMIVAVTVFLVSGTNAHTHTHQLRKMNIFPTLAEHTLPCRGHTRIRRRSPHKHCTIGIATPPFSLFFFPFPFFLSQLCVRAHRSGSQTSDEALAFVKTYCVRVCARGQLTTARKTKQVYNSKEAKNYGRKTERRGGRRKGASSEGELPQLVGRCEETWSLRWVRQTLRCPLPLHVPRSARRGGEGRSSTTLICTPAGVGCWQG